MPLELKYNGKKYTLNEGDWIVDGTIEKWIKIGALVEIVPTEEETEEVKENKEPPKPIQLGYKYLGEKEYKIDIEEKTEEITPSESKSGVLIDVSPEACIKDIENDVRRGKEQSILMRLRGQIEYWIAEAESCADTPNQYNHYRITVLREVLYILDSLSPQGEEETKVYYSTAIADIGKCGGVIIGPNDIPMPETIMDTISCTSSAWSPVKGEVIEVSNDGEKWEERKFVCRENIYGDNLYIVKNQGHEETLENDEVGYYYARPVENPIELLSIPEFNWSNDIMKGESNEFLISMLGIQLREITAFCQALRHRENNK